MELARALPAQLPIRMAPLNKKAGARTMARWARGERTVDFLVTQNRLESFEAADLGALVDPLIERATLQRSLIHTDM
jgi:hypothetical protein